MEEREGRRKKGEGRRGEKDERRRGKRKKVEGSRICSTRIKVTLTRSLISAITEQNR